MSSTAELAAFEAATTEAELTEAETDQVREMVAAGEGLDHAIGVVVSLRPAETAADAAGENGATAAVEPTEQDWKKLATENERHVARVRSIMGGFVEGFTTCKECEGSGLTPPGPQPQTHELFEACKTCQGFGDVLTGSLKEGNTSRPCPECLGRGYLEAIREDGTPVAPDGNAGGVPVPDVAQLVQQSGEQPAETGGGGVRMGAPAWMGDTSLGS